MPGFGERGWAADVLFWCIALAALAAARLPYLASPLYILDNDEAVLGTMARRMAAGEEWPFFFVGQNYGLAIFETAPTALAFTLFGDSAPVLTGTVLALFLLSLLAWEVTFRRVCGSRGWARALILVLAMTPGWVVWSTKARGLYVAGFALTGAATAVLTRWGAHRAGRIAAAGLTGLLALVQPLWLVVLFPFWMVLALPEERGSASAAPRGELVTVGAAAFLIWAVPTWVAAGRDAFWQPDFVQPQVDGVMVMPKTLLRAFGGVVAPNIANPATSLVGYVGGTAFFLTMSLMAIHVVRTRSRWALWIVVAMAMSVGHSLLVHFWVPRYFLPATVLLFVAVGVAIARRSSTFGTKPAVATAALLGALMGVAFTLGQLPRDSVLSSVTAREDLALLMRGLEGDGVEGVFAASSDVQWQLYFYGAGAIPTRGRSADDRYPALVEAVNRVRASGGRIALIADVRQLREEMTALGGFPGYRVGERYLRLDDPSDADLALLRFDFEPLEETRGGDPGP